MSVNFVYLAGGASFNIVGYEVFHVGPLVEGLDELNGFGNYRVASG